MSLFLDWYQPGLSAWTAFEVWDLVLAALSLAAIWLAVESLLWEARHGDAALPLVCVAAFVIVVSQLVNHPPATQGGSLDAGAWVALAGSALMAAAGALSAMRVSLSVSVSPRSRDGESAQSVAAPAAHRGPSPATEAAAAEPEVQDELYPEHERSAPIGANDPELWTAARHDDETLPLESEGDERR